MNRAMLARLIDFLPNFDPAWPHPLKDRWFDAWRELFESALISDDFTPSQCEDGALIDYVQEAWSGIFVA